MEPGLLRPTPFWGSDQAHAIDFHATREDWIGLEGVVLEDGLVLAVLRPWAAPARAAPVVRLGPRERHEAGLLRDCAGLVSGVVDMGSSAPNLGP